MANRSSKRLSKEEFIMKELEKTQSHQVSHEEDIDIKEKEDNRIKEVLGSDSDQDLYIPNSKEKSEISESEISDSENENEILVKSDWKARVKRKNELINPDLQFPRKMPCNSETLNKDTNGPIL